VIPTVPVVGVVVRVPMRVVSVVVMPVVRVPRVPVGGVVSPAPSRMPRAIVWTVNVNYNRPLRYLVESCGYSRTIIVRFGYVHAIPTVARIGGLCINWLNNVAGTIKGFVSNQLNLHRTVGKSFNHNYSYILILSLVKRNPKNNIMQIVLGVIENHDVINIIIVVQIEVVNHLLRIVKLALKSLKRFSALEEIHHGVKIKVVAG